MAAVAADLDTDGGPPMDIPLRHFIVALGFLFVAAVSGLTGIATTQFPFLPLAALHLFLVGWVCVTIMGAMTQFVPVWSGVSLHSRRLANGQLWLVAIGVAGFAAALTAGALRVAPWFGALMLVGFWCFGYNIARTLWACDEYDITERHFALAVGFLLLVTVLGLLLAIDFMTPLLSTVGLSHVAVRETHATLAGFGVVVTTIIGALYQLATMFTQTDLHGVDISLQRFEAVGYPLGVLALAAGRLWELAWLATGGGLLISAALLGVAVILARRLHETKVPWTPMLFRYLVAAVALAGWVILAVPTWLTAPLERGALFGGSQAEVVLWVGVVGFVVVGTLYHVIPFIMWVSRYSDQLGYEPVPMIDDLYSDRLAKLDFGLLTGGTILIIAARWLGRQPLVIAGGGLLVAGLSVFGANMLSVIRTHSQKSFGKILLGRALPVASTTTTATTAASDAGTSSGEGNSEK